MNEIQKHEPSSQSLSLFGNSEQFELGLRVAKLLSASDIVPQSFRGSIPNCLIALNIAHSLGANPFSVLQNMFVVHGKPSWSASFLIAMVNSSGRYSPLQHRMSGQGDELTCVAWAKHLDSGDIVDGPPVSIEMAKKEGWFGKSGSKWQTMPDLMLRYRSSAFFARLYCPDLCLGMRTAEEETDIAESRPAAKLFDGPRSRSPLPTRPEKPAEAQPVEVIEVEPEPEPEPDPRTGTLAEVLELITSSSAKIENVEGVLRRMQLLGKTGTVARLGQAKLQQIKDQWIEIESKALNPNPQQFSN